MIQEFRSMVHGGTSSTANCKVEVNPQGLLDLSTSSASTKDKGGCKSGIAFLCVAMYVKKPYALVYDKSRR